MRILSYAALPLLLMGSALSGAAYAQSVAQPGTVQVQANPRGDEPVAASADPASANDPVPATQPSDPAYHAGPYAGALSAPPADAMNKTYPLCSARVQDSCRNADGR